MCWPYGVSHSCGNGVDGVLGGDGIGGRGAGGNGGCVGNGDDGGGIFVVWFVAFALLLLLPVAAFGRGGGKT